MAASIFASMIAAPLLVSPLDAQASKQPPAAKRPPRDTLTAAERREIQKVRGDAGRLAKQKFELDSTERRARAAEAAPTAFSDGEARETLARARVARVSQDSALIAYRANVTQRISVGLGVRRVGLEKLLWRADNVAKVSWKQGVGVRVTPVGSRMTVPMASSVAGHIVDAVPIPYFPGSETLWFPGDAFGTVRSDIEETELIHPLAIGAETYYRYETGDSSSITLPDGKMIRLRELRIRARKPHWRSFVGSFWFDRDGGQLVRAAYRTAGNIEIWDVADEEIERDADENAEMWRLRDSIARARLPRETYVKDSIRQAPYIARMKAKGMEPGQDEKPPKWVTATFRPARAKVEAISVEYALYQGRFWLPRQHSATASAEFGFMRAPVTIDEKFTYDEVNGDFSMKPVPDETTRPDQPNEVQRQLPDSLGLTDSTTTDVSINVGGKSDTTARGRQRQDSIALSRNPSQRRQCANDSLWTRTNSRFEGKLRVAYDMPCQLSKLATAKELPPAYASDEELFDTKTRDELLASLDMGLQSVWAPQPIRLNAGFNNFRYNRIEGLSVAATATQELGAGYTLSALGRIGHADLHANGEFTVARSTGTRVARGTVYHRLAAVNPEWSGALSLSPSLPALLYGRDEGFYYRTFGVELGETREGRRGALDYRLFIERQYTAGDSSVAKTFSLGRIFDRDFPLNITAEPVSLTGVAGTWQRAFGNDPNGLRLVSVARAEAATGTFDFGRLALEENFSRPIGRFSTALSLSGGSTVGRVPLQRLWFVGGSRTVRGQSPNLTTAGNAFWLARSELGTKFGFARPVLFFDAGWSGPRDGIGKTKPQRGAGFGFGFLDGLFRIDFSRGIYPSRGWRTDLYLGALL